MGWYEGTGWGTWLVMVLVMVAFWTLVVVGIVALLRWTASMVAFWTLVVVGIVALLRWTASPRPATPPPGVAGASRPSSPDPARAVLDERLARGDIDEAEYRSRLATLRGGA